MGQRLADFIEANSPTIVDRAAQVAASFSLLDPQPVNGHLREHLPVILEAIAQDLRTAQSDAEAVHRAQTPVLAAHQPETVTGAYARLRAQSGFTLEQVFAEYRALRESVLTLWSDSSPPDEHALKDMARFNQAIDQALAESIANFSAESEGWRNVFLGTLAHDLRGPLSVNLLTAELLTRIISEDAPAAPLIERLRRSGARMKSLLDDLLDYSKASLGGGLRIVPTYVDLDPELQDELDLLRPLFPEHEVSYQSSGSTTGLFDSSRIREAMANLVINAAKHGDENGPIRVTLAGDAAATTLSVENSGPVVPDHTMSALFMPFGHFREGPDSNPEADSLGLGLFIVRQIAVAHGGTVAATSVGGRTLFTMRLPRISHS